MIVSGPWRARSRTGRSDGDAVTGAIPAGRRPWWAWTVSFTVFAAVLVTRNTFLFNTKLYEAADMAANSIQIDQARHLRLLVGDYSRLGFHHPGPAYLYVQAWGQELFYNLLHAVPTPWNGQVLAVYVLNAMFVTLAVAVCHGWTRSVATTAACLAVFAAFAAVHPMILSSDWMSYLYVPTYTLFVIAVASVAAGRGRADAWIATLAGWFLLHGHASYLFFVPVLTVAAIAIWLWLARRSLPGSLPVAPLRSLRQFLAMRRAVWVPVAVISAVFLLPIVVNLALHWPGDFGKYFGYGSSGRAGGHPLGAVLGYALWFWWPGTSAPSPAVLLAVVVAGYAVAGGLAWWCPRPPVRRFLLALLAMNLVSAAAFICYALIGIDNLTRNGHYIGYFSWSAPLITALVIAVGLAEAAARALTGRATAYVAVAVAVMAVTAFAVVPLTRTSTAYTDPGAPWMSPPDTDPAIPGAVAVLAADSHGATLTLKADHGAWEDLTGFLVQAERTGVRACVADPRWKFLVTGQFICTPAEAASGARYYLHFSGVPTHGKVLAAMHDGPITAGWPK